MRGRICIGLSALFTAALLVTILVAAEKAAEKAAEGAPPEAPAANKQPNDDIIGALNAEGNFKIALAALDDTKLTATLREKGPFTFFAPTDEAFERVPKLAALLNDTPGLKVALSRHIVLDRKIMTSDLASEKTIVTMNGDGVEVSDNGNRVHEAKITKGDIPARNGVIHAVDHVFMEENDSALRSAGYTLEKGVKSGARKVYDGLKTGAGKIKRAFSDDKSEEKPAEEKSQPQEQPADSTSSQTGKGNAK